MYWPPLDGSYFRDVIPLITSSIASVGLLDIVPQLISCCVKKLDRCPAYCRIRPLDVVDKHFELYGDRLSAFDCVYYFVHINGLVEPGQSLDIRRSDGVADLK